MALQRKWAINGEAVEDVEPKGAEPAPSSGKPNLSTLYRTNQIAKAEAYFKALDADDQQDLIAKYNEQQITLALRLKTKATKPSEAAFFQWLMKDLWGELNAEDLVEYAQTLLSKI